MKEFIEILAKEEKKVFIHFPREERGQTRRMALALEGWGFESFIGLQRARCRKRGWVYVYSGPQQYPGLAVSL